MTETAQPALNVLDELVSIRDYVLKAQDQLKSGEMPDMTALEKRTADLCRIIRSAAPDLQQKCAPELKELAKQLDECELELRAFFDTASMPDLLHD
jgi:hypothetical protein